MDELHFSVRSSSSDEIYSLLAKRTDRGVRFACSCPAGANGTYCKHRIGLIAGDIRKVVDPNENDIAALHEMVATSEIPAALDAVAAIERSIDALKADLAKAKKRLAAIMMG
ncbi:MAG: hypothetical protein KDJ44_00675 [Rhodoblastus sp.]|nr:hypothetical protein [Rhodoblastus sp.]